MMRSVLGAVAAAVLATSAMAGEFYDVYAWSDARKVGQLIYETDSGNMAVYRSGDGNERYYIRQMAGDVSPSGTYQGFFVDYSGSGRPACPSGPGRDHLGNSIPHWGHLRMEWLVDEGGEPQWVMYIGVCNDPISAEPLVASYQAH